MKVFVLCVVLSVVWSGLAAADAAADWSVIASWWRSDANPYAGSQVWEGTFWSEGWKEPEQFYPAHFQPSGSVHLLIKSTSPRARSLQLVSVDGKPLKDVATTEDKAGPVIWYRVECPQFPVGEITAGDEGFDTQEVPAGAWAECIVRFRTPPAGRAVKLGFETGSGPLEVSVPMETPVCRIESVCFSRDLATAYVYVRSLDGAPVSPGRVFVDGAAPAFQKWSAGPEGSGIALAEVTLRPALKPSTFHLFTVQMSDGSKLAWLERAWDGYFTIGLFGTVDEQRVQAAKEHGINTYFSGPSDILDNAGLNYIPHGNVGHPRKRTADQSGLLFYYNHDEPDAHDVSLGEALPWMQRLGVFAQRKVLPLQRYQRQQDRITPNLLLVNNTYKPLNWYVYGQIPDVFCTDPYVPLGGRQLDYIWRALECARDASAPSPVVAVLWACKLDSGQPRNYGRRPPTPEEDGYFIDLTRKTGEGQFGGVSDYPELWAEVGRTNHDAAALAPYLVVGCPVGAPEQQDKVWVRSIMCGPDRIAVIAVNTDHYIGYETQTLFAFHREVKQSWITVPLPPGYESCRVREVRDGRIVDFTGASMSGGRLAIPLDSLDAARGFIVERGKE